MLRFHKEIVKEFEPIGKKAKIILFGSVASGTYRFDSDIDLAIISDDKKIKQHAEKIADKVLVKYGKVVSLKFISPKSMNTKDPFIKEILKGKVVYDGSKRSD